MDDFSTFMILPPANTLRAQIFLNNDKTAELIHSGIEVTYQIIENTSSADKTNFWEYAKDYGYNIAPNVGITGNCLSGKMILSEDGNYYEATAIPVTPYNDGSRELNPYQLAIITVTDIATGNELAMVDNIVIPVSDEMLCSTCHSTVNTGLNILKAHDKNSNTTLVNDLDAGIRHKCSDCHADNILEEPGISDIPSLSLAMHSFHANKMFLSNITPECYSCHPGPVTKCYRGVMSNNRISCVNSNCHGNMRNVAVTQTQGRDAWLDEPNCSNCHPDKYGVNSGQLYHTSYLMNSEAETMNGIILCSSCHNSPHAEWVSANPKDNLFPIKLLGYPSYVNKCNVCHNGNGEIHKNILDK
jgi:hypothetical protein